MRKFVVIAVSLLLLPSVALATHIEVVGSADCDGWNASVGIVWSQFALDGDLSYSVVLIDGAGNEVVRDEWTGAFQYDPAGGNTHEFSGSWGMELCGDYTVVGTMHHIFYAADGSIYTEVTEGFTSAFNCICDTPTGCFFTPGYWKNHEEMWPVTSLTLGGVVYSQAELLEIMSTPVRGDATIILSYHLIAAKLNVLSGAADLVGDTITGADDLLARYPIGSKPRKPGRSDVLDHKDILADYNEQGCVDEMEIGMKSLGLTITPDKAEEDVSWGGIKSIFR